MKFDCLEYELMYICHLHGSCQSFFFSETFISIAAGIKSITPWLNRS